MSDLDALRDWYAEVQAPTGQLAPGDVISSWRGRFRPGMARLTRDPTAEELAADPGRYVRSVRPERCDRCGEAGAEPVYRWQSTELAGHLCHLCRWGVEGTDWYAFLPETAAQEPYDGPCPDLFPDGAWSLTPSRGGVTVQTADGRMLRDREAAIRALPPATGLPADMLRDLMPSGRVAGAQKGSAVHIVARALAWESLRLRLGPRAAGRCLLVWDDDLATPWADPTTADLARIWEAGKADRLTPAQRRTLRGAVTVVMRSAWRTLAKLGIQDARQIG